MNNLEYSQLDNSIESMLPAVNKSFYGEAARVEITGGFLKFLTDLGVLVAKYFIRNGQFKLPQIWRYPFLVADLFKLIKGTFKPKNEKSMGILEHGDFAHRLSMKSAPDKIDM